jgi:hypothetical protein
LLLHTVLSAQQTAIALNKNDPELRAILAEIEADAEQARVKEKFPVYPLSLSTIRMFCWLRASATIIREKLKSQVES